MTKLVKTTDSASTQRSSLGNSSSDRTKGGRLSNESGRSVRFARPVVTCVYTIPRTSQPPDWGYGNYRRQPSTETESGSATSWRPADRVCRLAAWSECKFCSSHPAPKPRTDNDAGTPSIPIKSEARKFVDAVPVTKPLVIRKTGE